MMAAVAHRLQLRQHEETQDGDQTGQTAVYDVEGGPIVRAEPTLHHHGPAFEAVVLPNSGVLVPLPRVSPYADATFV